MLLNSNDEARLHAIERLRLREHDEDPALVSLVKQAATLCSAPAALFSILGGDFAYVKASFGCSFDSTQPREFVLSSRVVETERFCTFSFRRDDTSLRFYAGTPVFVDDVCIGSLVVLDAGDREITASDRYALAAIASAIGGILEERTRAAPPDAGFVETGLSFTDNAWMLFALRPGEPLPRVEYANARAREITGFSLDDLMNDPQRFYNSAGYTDAISLAIERAMTGDATPAHVEVQAPDGSMIWLEGKARRLSDGRDGSMRFMTIARDVTEQKRAEAFRDLLAEAIRRTPEAVFIVRMNGEQLAPQVLYANESFFTLTRYEPSEYPKILGEASNAVAVRDAVHAILAGRSAEGETLVYRRDGTTFLAHYRAHPIDAPDRHAVIILKDVTEERARMRELAMLSSAIEQAEDFIGIVDDTPVEQGGPLLIYTNPAIQRASGYSSDELLGKPYNILHSPNNPQKMTSSVRDTISAGKDGYRELLLRRKDGTDLWVEMVGRTFVDPTTNRSFRVTVGRDISLRRRAFNQTALLFESANHSPNAIVLYEPNNDGALEATWENVLAERSGRKRLLTLWNGDSDVGRRIRGALENGERVTEIFVDTDDHGSPVLVQFSARSIRNESRLEAILTVERVMAAANHVEETGQSLLLRVVGMLPAIVAAQSTSERLTILRAILLDAFEAEVHPSSAQLKDDDVHIAMGWKGATFRLGEKTYAARWTRELESVALTSLRLCIEATIEAERKAAKL